MTSTASSWTLYQPLSCAQGHSFSRERYKRDLSIDRPAIALYAIFSVTSTKWSRNTYICCCLTVSSHRKEYGHIRDSKTKSHASTTCSRCIALHGMASGRNSRYLKKKRFWRHRYRNELSFKRIHESPRSSLQHFPSRSHLVKIESGKHNASPNHECFSRPSQAGRG